MKHCKNRSEALLKSLGSIAQGTVKRCSNHKEPKYKSRLSATQNTAPALRGAINLRSISSASIFKKFFECWRLLIFAAFSRSFALSQRLLLQRGNSTQDCPCRFICYQYFWLVSSQSDFHMYRRYFYDIIRLGNSSKKLLDMQSHKKPNA